MQVTEIEWRKVGNGCAVKGASLGLRICRFQDNFVKPARHEMSLEAGRMKTIVRVASA